MKKIVRINEGQLRDMIKSAVRKTLSELHNPGMDGDDYNAVETMDWPFEKGNDVWEEIAKEGGMSWTDGDTHFKIVKNGDKYLVYDENDELMGSSAYLHKAQKYLYMAVVDYLEGLNPDDEDEMESEDF